MQAVAGRHVDGHAERVFEKMLDADKIDQRKLLLRIIVDEQVKIAVGLRFIARGRSKR